MRALVHDPDAPRGLRLGEAPDPTPAPGQALVEVAAISLNFGELAHVAEQHAPGDVLGWDAAGVIREPAADGSGPPAGTRVVTFGWSAGWAELRAVETTELAPVPDGVDLRTASALPVAGVTALRALRTLGAILGRRVLVTGASGGVGRIAVQLAARAGAEVVAVVGSPARGEGLRELGAAEVRVGLDGIAPVDGVLDNVGGPMLAEAFALLSAGGLAVSIGKASGEPTTIDFEAIRLLGGERRIQTFTMGAGLGPDLGVLVELLRHGELDPQIGWRGPWERAPEAADALLNRQVLGKAVLNVS